MSRITNKLELIIEQLNAGEIAGIPTETVYGLAADAGCETAIKKVFACKKRPANHPLILHVSHQWDLTQWVTTIPDYAYALMEAYWPGPLTLILPLKIGAINPIVTGGQNSIAVRAPQHPLAQALLLTLAKPVVAPSANPFGKISPTTAEHVQQSFPNEDFLILDGGRCAIGVESTLINALDSDGYQILRHGTLNAEQLARVASRIHDTQANSVRAPGQLATHYQPEKPVYYTSDWQTALHELSEKPYLFTFSRRPEDSTPLSYTFGLDPEHAAYELYYRLRLADLSNADFILVELPPNHPNWLAIREKILKAGTLWTAN